MRLGLVAVRARCFEILKDIAVDVGEKKQAYKPEILTSHVLEIQFKSQDFGYKSEFSYGCNEHHLLCSLRSAQKTALL